MAQDFFIRESGKLTYGEILERLRAVSEESGFADARHAGIFRQIVAQGLTSMSDKQWSVFRQEMVPLTVERCSIASCTNPTWPGLEHCPTHQSRFGESGIKRHG